MTNITHTSGPWSNLCHPDNNEDTATIVDPDGRIVALATADSFPIPAIYPYVSVEEAIGNARLISAAPELLEALETIINGTGAGLSSDAYKKADLAIAKARGAL